MLMLRERVVAERNFKDGIARGSERARGGERVRVVGETMGDGAPDGARALRFDVGEVDGAISRSRRIEEVVRTEVRGVTAPASTARTDNRRTLILPKRGLLLTQSQVSLSRILWNEETPLDYDSIREGPIR